LFIVAFAASNAQEAAFRFGNKFVPFTQHYHPPKLTNYQFS
jgi:hypothetical protein